MGTAGPVMGFVVGSSEPGCTCVEIEAQAARTKLVLSGSLSACTASELSLSFCCMEPDTKLRPGRIGLCPCFQGTLHWGACLYTLCLFTFQGHFYHACCQQSPLCSPKLPRSLNLFTCLCTLGKFPVLAVFPEAILSSCIFTSVFLFTLVTFCFPLRFLH